MNSQHDDLLALAFARSRTPNMDDVCAEYTRNYTTDSEHLAGEDHVCYSSSDTSHTDRKTIRNSCDEEDEIEINWQPETNLNSSSNESIHTNSNKPNENDFRNYKSNVQKCTNTRTYRFITRCSNPRLKSQKSKRWENELEEKSDEELRNEFCCVKLRCFQKSNPTFLRQKMCQLRSCNCTERRAVLLDMINSQSKFSFDGRTVCTTFLLKAFRFSRKLQISAKHLFQKKHSTIPESIMNHVVSSSENTFAHNPSATSNLATDSILTFLDRAAAETADRMPDKEEFHLPFFTKKCVYEIFTKEFAILYPRMNVPVLSSFVHTWKKFRNYIKVRKYSRFTKCSTCERLRAALGDAFCNRQETRILKDQKRLHHEFIRRERLEYQSKRERAILYPADYLSLVIDGADQSAFTLPHFAVKTKEQRGVGIKIHLIGVLQHRSLNRLSLYTMTDEHQTGSNHVVEAMHRCINDLSKEGPLPKNLHLQLDNCSRENKNRFLFSYLQALVSWGVFRSIEAAFLPVGHTHCDVDQAFSCTSTRLKLNDAITMEDMNHQLRQCYNGITSVTSMKEVANWSGLCQEAKCCNSISQISQYRYFKFMLTNEKDSNCQSPHVECTVKRTVDDQWKVLEDGKKGVAITFLKFVPNLSETPPEQLTEPEDVHKINLRIQSEEARIGSDQKLHTLYNLRDLIYRTRKSKFHWDLSSVVEGGRKNGEDWSIDANSPAFAQVMTNCNYKYSPGSMLVVQPEKTEGGLPFWIAQVLDAKLSDGVVVGLNVCWYEFYGSSCVFNSMYRPCKSVQSKLGKPSEEAFWTDIISPNTVLVTFERLTTSKRIPAAVRNHIQEYCSTSGTINRNG